MNKFLLIGFFCVIYSGYLQSLPIDHEDSNGPNGDIPLSPESIDEVLLNEREFVDPNDADSQGKRDSGDLTIQQINENDDPFQNEYPTEDALLDANHSSGGDTTKTLLSYTILESPSATATLNGFRQTTLLENGTVVGGTGVSIDLKQKSGLVASVGALRPDLSKSTIVHFSGSGKLINSSSTVVGFNAKATRVVGGSDNGKSTLNFKPKYQKFTTNINKLVTKDDAMANASSAFALAQIIQSLVRPPQPKAVSLNSNTDDDLMDLFRFIER